MNLIERLLWRRSRTSQRPMLAMPIVIGLPRSGTTLLRLMLDAHPQLAMPPETGFLAFCGKFTETGAALRREFFERVTHFPENAPNWSDFGIPEADFMAALERIRPFNVADGYRTFYRLYAQRFDKPRYGDKTPTYYRYINTITATLPEAHFIHIIRDGRDVALSVRDMWFSPGKDVETLATHWRDGIVQARTLAKATSHYHELHYEQLIAHPRRELEKICRFIGLEYAPDMERYHERAPDRLREFGTRYKADGSVLVERDARLNAHRLTSEPPDPSRVFAWRREMPAEEQQRYNAIAGEMLQSLGYEL